MKTYKLLILVLGISLLMAAGALAVSYRDCGSSKCSSGGSNYYSYSSGCRYYSSSHTYRSSCSSSCGGYEAYRYVPVKYYSYREYDTYSCRSYSSGCNVRVEPFKVHRTVTQYY